MKNEKKLKLIWLKLLKINTTVKFIFKILSVLVLIMYNIRVVS